MKYVVKCDESTVTIFVPYDCGNNCPFCINKKEYADMTGFSLERIIKSIKLVNKFMPSCNIVFTGGEPLANLDSLQKMLDVVGSKHKVFINTTLPTSENYTIDDILDFVNQNANKITSLNISRHLHKFVIESPDVVLRYLKVPFRINCVIYEKFNDTMIKEFIERFTRLNTHVQFRKDYTQTTLENLFDEKNDDILKALKHICVYKGVSSKEDFRIGYNFEHRGFKLNYHKTLPYSTIDDKLTDIIIRQNGDILSDWNDYGKKVNLEDLIII